MPWTLYGADGLPIGSGGGGGTGATGATGPDGIPGLDGVTGATGPAGSPGGGGPTVKKTADETVNNSAVLQNDDHLSFAVTANKTYYVMLFLYVTNTSGTTGTIQYDFTLPAGATAKRTEVSGGLPQTPSTTHPWTQSALAPAGVFLPYYFIITVAGTAGTAQFQWAQNVAAAYDLVMKQGSVLEYLEC